MAGTTNGGKLKMAENKKWQETKTGGNKKIGENKSTRYPHKHIQG
jgi:hypothetical protein